jgi:endonuclease/exonuclease/phosphatase family metal-dependent hydrolase
MDLQRQGRARWLLTRALSTLKLGSILATSGLLIFVFQPFGDRLWVFLVVGAAIGIVLFAFRGAGRADVRSTHGTEYKRRGLGATRGAIAAALACWMGLILVSALSPGGRWPPPKGNLAAIRVMTWNILVGVESGLPWNRHGWSVRKKALGEALRAIAPDILCVQEALDGQVRFLEAELPNHRRVGVGRDDGRSAGEHCAIYFDASRFQQLDGGTFWLEAPADKPPNRPVLLPKRICTWLRLEDRLSGRAFRIYNAHLYLTERARLRAVQIILGRIAQGDPSDSLVVAGDFNTTPDAPSRQLFTKAGLVSSAHLAGQYPEAPSYQFYGIRIRSLDGFYLSPGWRVQDQRTVSVKPGNTFPSDHFGVLVDLELPDRVHTE